jgi:hypothetical protein
MMTTRFKLFVGFEAAEIEEKANKFFDALTGADIVNVRLMAKPQGYALLVVYQLLVVCPPPARKPTTGAASKQKGTSDTI